MERESKNTAVSEMPTIFDYLDYREYLQDYYDAKKAQKKGFSYKVLANKIGFTANTQVILIIQGKRNLNSNLIPRFAEALNLNSRERKYFECLVQFNQAKDADSKQYYYEQLLPIYKKTHGYSLKDDQYRYLANWYVPVIREMISLKDFREDPRWISWKLKRRITATEAEDALKLLLDLNLVVRGEDGRLRATDTHVVTPKKVADIAAHRYHKQMISLATSSMNESRKHTERSFAGFTSALSKKQLEKIQQKLYDFIDSSLHELSADDDDHKEVYHINFHMFSLTNLRGEA